MIPGDLMAEIRDYLAPPEKPTTQCLRAKVYGRLLLDHIDAMAAGEAKLRALHHEDEHGYCPADGDDWPCDTIRILDGET